MLWYLCSGKKIYSYYHKKWLDRLKQIISWQTKKSKTAKNTRQWTENELELLAEVLADPENNFAISVDKLALKKSSNNEAFEHIKNTFEMEMDNGTFKQNMWPSKRQCCKVQCCKVQCSMFKVQCCKVQNAQTTAKI